MTASLPATPDPRVETLQQAVLEAHRRSQPISDSEPFEAALASLAAELAQARQALLGVRERTMPDDSACFCPEWQWETFCEELFEDYQHHPCCLAARAVLAGEDTT